MTRRVAALRAEKPDYLPDASSLPPTPAERTEEALFRAYADACKSGHLLSRRVVGWEFADHMRVELPLKALERALKTRQLSSA